MIALCQFDHRLPRIDTAAVRSDIDLDQHVEGGANRARRRVEVGHVLRIVYADTHPGALPQCRQARDLARADDFVADHDVHHAALDHGFGFGNLLAAHTDGTVRHLPKGDFRAFVGFGVRAYAHLEPGQRLIEAVKIALECVQVQ